jgi:DNA polymerase III subunit epsilon
MSWNTWVAFDTETTGLGSDARIIEIALVAFKDGEIVEQWDTLLEPEGVNWDDPNVQRALEVNKIERSKLAGAPKFGDVFHRLALHFRSADVWVAHNAEFDLRMLDQEYKALKGESFPIRPKLCLCTKLLSNQVHAHERSHRLDAVAPRWGVTPDGAHRAASDAITCGRILASMRTRNALPNDFGELEEFQKVASSRWSGSKRR